MTRSNQRAGSNSQQMTVTGDVHVGLSVEEAMRIAELVAQNVVAEYTQEALAEANERIAEFDRRLVSLMDEGDALESFRSPAFQVLVKKAQRSAASSGRDDDFDRLARLLADRAEEGDRKKRAAVDQAVQVVDLVDDDALIGLVAARLVLLNWTMDGQVGTGLDRMDRFVSVLVPSELPPADAWVDHAESLGLVRTSRSETFNNSAQILSESMPGYVCAGVDEADSQTSQAAMVAGLFGAKRLPLVAHELRPGFLRYPVSNAAHLEVLVKSNEGDIPPVAELRSLLAEHTGFPTIEPSLVQPLRDAVAQRPHLETLFNWWDQQPLAYRITRAGLVLASAQSSALLAQARRDGILDLK